VLGGLDKFGKGREWGIVRHLLKSLDDESEGRQYNSLLLYLRI